VKRHKRLDFPFNDFSFHLSNPLKTVKCCIKPLNCHFRKYSLRLGKLYLKSNADRKKDDMAEFMEAMGFMQSCTTSWTSASSLFPVCHYWAKL